MTELSSFKNFKGFAVGEFELAVVGLGYVGMPLAQEATSKGLTVVGFDVSSAVVQGLMSGESHIDDITDSQVRTMLEHGFEATTDPQVLGEAEIICVCVPTPLSTDGGPDLSAVLQSAMVISDHMKPGALVIYESTTYPGSTEQDIRPVLESNGRTAGVDFSLAFSPERVDPGNARFGISNTPKVVGGLTPSCAERARAHYARFIDEVVVAKGLREAEMAKLLENTYRHINIALVNEMAKFSHSLQIDFWDVIRCASTKPFGFQPFYPGPGVGGHCIPIDPNYLAFKVQSELGYRFRFVELAQEINNSMPAYVVDRCAELLNDHGLAVNGAKILLLGVTYKSDIADQRESPAVPVARELRRRRAQISFSDPHVEHWIVDGEAVSPVDNLDRALQQSDLVVLLQAHREYDLEKLSEASLLLDTRGKTKPKQGQLL